MGAHFLSQYSLASTGETMQVGMENEAVDSEGRPQAPFAIPASYLKKAKLVRKILQKMCSKYTLIA
jgi:hypothetical protein